MMRSKIYSVGFKQKIEKKFQVSVTESQLVREYELTVRVFTNINVL